MKVKNLHAFVQTDSAVANIVRVWIFAHFRNHNAISVPTAEN